MQLSGASLEMGYLGAQERRADPATGLIQMGIRSYDPALGRFLTEDPVYGHLGIGASIDRYLYVWDNPLNLYDLNGRDVCVPTPFGGACAGDAAEDVAGAAQDTAETATSSASSAADASWDWTAPGRQWFGDRAQDFWKQARGPLSEIYDFAGAHWQTCIEGGTAGAGVGATVGLGAGPEGPPIGATAGAIIGCGNLVQAEILIEISSE